MLMIKQLGRKIWWYERPWLLAITIGSFLAGLFSGWLGAKTLSTQQLVGISQEVTDLLERIQVQQPMNGLFNDALIKQELWLIKIIFFGSSYLGLPLIMALVFSRGFGLGYTLAIILTSFPIIQGVLIILTGVLPHNLLGVPLCIVVDFFSAHRSLNLLDGIKMTVNSNYHPSNLKLLFTILVFMVVGIGVSAIESFISPLLISILHF